MTSIQQRLQSLGLAIPDAPRPLGNFAPYLLDRGNLYISGQIGLDAHGAIVRGKLGQGLTLDAGIEAARLCAVGLLGRAKAAVGDLERIDRIIKLGVFVNAAEAFCDHASVADGASDLMIAVFGVEIGSHARFVVGSPGLPAGAAVEVDALFTVRD
jgi:enamine deaminase RidA (YjgF/YER057c/UK114 family)